MQDDTHLIGLYVTFVFMIFLLVMPYIVIKYVKRTSRRTKQQKE